jgi:hypothetical protein
MCIIIVSFNCQCYWIVLVQDYISSSVWIRDVVEASLPYTNATNIFLQISKNISYFKILINLRTYITYIENIASFNVLHKPVFRIDVIFFQYAGNFKIKRARKQEVVCFNYHSGFLRISAATARLPYMRSHIPYGMWPRHCFQQCCRLYGSAVWSWKSV